jgi:hypothetical protein
MNTTTKTIPELAAEEARLWEAVKAANNSYENARNIWHPVRVALDKAIADAEAEQRILARMAAEKEAAK